MNGIAAEPRTRALLVFAALCALVIAALYLFMVRTEAGHELDASAYNGIAGQPGIGIGRASALLKTIAAGTVVLATALLAALALARGRPWLALTALGVIGGSFVLTELLKFELLSRPDLLAPGETRNSFPSGHATIATSLGIAAAIVVPAWLRPAALLGAVAYASAVGIAAVATSWHRPSDIAAAYLVTVGVAALAFALLGRRATDQEPATEAPRRAQAAVALGAVIGLLAFLVVAIAQNAQTVDWTTVDRGFLAFALALPLLAAALIGTLAWLAWGHLTSARLAARERA